PLSPFPLFSAKLKKAFFAARPFLFPYSRRYNSRFSQLFIILVLHLHQLFMGAGIKGYFIIFGQNFSRQRIYIVKVTKRRYGSQLTIGEEILKLLFRGQGYLFDSQCLLYGNKQYSCQSPEVCEWNKFYVSVI